jgi:hypothetical protein
MAEEYTKDQLTEWFEGKARALSPGAARNVILGANTRKKDVTFVGKLYFFRYDAKGKKVLPMWDRYPMAIILERKPDGFLGLNLHYLSGGQRSTMLKIIDKYKSEYKMKTSVSAGNSVNWDNLMDSLSSTTLEALPRKCIKRYLYTHCRSKFIEIYPEEYSKAIQLPIEEWVIKR